MKLIGLTGSIGAGKSAAVQWLRAQGIAVHDADAAVHEIYARPETLAWVQEHFPDAVTGGALDKNQLARIIFSDAEAKKKLEAYMHVEVAAHRADFGVSAAGAPMIVFDIPLLFEVGAEDEFDEVWLLTAPDDVRRARVMKRPNMTAEKFEKINAAQMPQDEKARRTQNLSGHVIDNSGTLEALHEKLQWLIGRT